MPLTTDPNDPRLGHGRDTKPGPQNEVYLVLSEEERGKGFVRPFRDTYLHVGLEAPPNLRDLTDDERARYPDYGYQKYEEYPPERAPVVGRFWTRETLDRIGAGCKTVTHMGYELSATYARDPNFYGSTYCCVCRMHLPVAEFRWIESDGRLGPTVGS